MELTWFLQVLLPPRCFELNSNDPNHGDNDVFLVTMPCLMSPQCSKCRDSFQGHPVGGQQCYRLLAVEQEYCLDPWSQSHCFPPPQRRPLPPGRSVPFAVQPKFTNVDIRLTLDVTFGAVDLFVATSYDTFAVDVDPATGWHRVRLQAPGGGAFGGSGGTFGTGDTFGTGGGTLKSFGTGGTGTGDTFGTGGGTFGGSGGTLKSFGTGGDAFGTGDTFGTGGGTLKSFGTGGDAFGTGDTFGGSSGSFGTGGGTFGGGGGTLKSFGTGTSGGGTFGTDAKIPLRIPKIRLRTPKIPLQPPQISIWAPKIPISATKPPVLATKIPISATKLHRTPQISIRAPKTFALATKIPPQISKIQP
ncbi:hypothetical protein TURU_037997 [Turdus rufiventris]|nr:hypothetical protein TURU_037997 [Turdus rufiventris]